MPIPNGCPTTIFATLTGYEEDDESFLTESSALWLNLWCATGHKVRWAKAHVEHDPDALALRIDFSVEHP